MYKTPEYLFFFLEQNNCRGRSLYQHTHTQKSFNFSRAATVCGATPRAGAAISPLPLPAANNKRSFVW